MHELGCEWVSYPLAMQALQTPPSMLLFQLPLEDPWHVALWLTLMRTAQQQQFHHSASVWLLLLLLLPLPGA